jgi:hypothetical protein
MAMHHHGHRVAHKQHVDARLINLRHAGMGETKPGGGSRRELSACLHPSLVGHRFHFQCTHVSSAGTRLNAHAPQMGSRRQ